MGELVISFLGAESVDGRSRVWLMAGLMGLMCWIDGLDGLVCLVVLFRWRSCRPMAAGMMLRG